LDSQALESFARLKDDLAKAGLGTVQDDLAFEFESDASDYAIANILSQVGRPVAFMSRSLNIYERNYPAVEKEATAITEAVRKWAHFLKGGNFALVTDQRSVFFMFDKTNHGKIKNSKILMWRLELRQFRYEIHHKPGVENVASDAFSRICGALNTSNSLAALHATLGHPRYDRLYHFIRARNLPFTCDETKAVAASVKFAPNTSLAFINGNLQV